MKTSKLLISPTTFEALSLVAGVNHKAERVDIQWHTLKDIALNYFGHRNGYKPTNIPMSNISEMDFVTREQFEACVNALFHGVGVEGWDGLLGGGRKNIHLPNGVVLYVPMPSVMKSFITEEIKQNDNGEDYTCYFLTDASTAFMSLLRTVLVHVSTGQACWALAADSYKERLTSSLFRGGKADSYTVKGRTVAMAGLPGIKKDEVFASFLTMKGVAKNGEIVDYSKAPVLFDNAVRGLKLVTRLPAEYYPTLRNDEMFNYALRNFGGVHHDYVTAAQDDCDGDLAQLTTSGGAIPLHTGEYKNEMAQFIEEYRAGELDMKESNGVRTYCHLKAKSYKAYNAEEVTSAVVESVNAKRSVGLYTDSCMKMSYALSVDQNNTKPVLTFEQARLVRNAMAIAIQIMSMKAIKHSNGLADEVSMMYNKMCPRYNYETCSYEMPDTALVGIHELKEFMAANMNTVSSIDVREATENLLSILMPLSGSEVGNPDLADIAFTHRTMSSNLSDYETVACVEPRSFRGRILNEMRAMFSV